MHVCMCVLYVGACICVYVHVCVHTCACVHACVCMLMHVHNLYTQLHLFTPNNVCWSPSHAEHAPESEKKALREEIELMKSLDYHPHLVRMLGCCTAGDHLALVMEYMSRGNLLDYLVRQRSSDTVCQQSESL